MDWESLLSNGWLTTTSLKTSGWLGSIMTVDGNSNQQTLRRGKWKLFLVGFVSVGPSEAAMSSCYCCLVSRPLEKKPTKPQSLPNIVMFSYLENRKCGDTAIDTSPHREAFGSPMLHSLSLWIEQILTWDCTWHQRRALDEHPNILTGRIILGMTKSTSLWPRATWGGRNQQLNCGWPNGMCDHKKQVYEV